MGPTDFESKTRGLDPYAYLHGKAFFDASKTIEGTYHQSHVRAAMQAFAIEVLLKSMQSVSHVKQVYSKAEGDNSYALNDEKSFHKIKYPNGHDVLKVFKQLDADIQLMLCATYKELKERDFYDDLAEIGDLFVGLRYLYEERSFSYSGRVVENVAAFLIEFIEKYQKMDLFQEEHWVNEI